MRDSESENLAPVIEEAPPASARPVARVDAAAPLPVVAVVVTFHPRTERLAALVERLLEEVQHVLVVDNGPGLSGVTHGPSGRRLDRRRLGFVALEENRGVATAQNEGIRRARQLDPRFILLMDQDSMPEAGMVGALVEEHRRLQRLGRQVAAVGPRLVDPALPRFSPFVRFQRGWLRKHFCQSADRPCDVGFLLSSGMLLSLEALDAIGPMRDELFIDYVDVEWSLRARASGWELFGLCSAGMRHELGDRRRSLLGRRFPVRSPLRNYYYFRNALWMYRNRRLPLRWKLWDGARVFAQLFVFVALGDERRRRIRLVLRGLGHGLRGRLGRLDGSS